MSVYPNDNAFLETILYEKKNGYFSFFLFSEERMFFLRFERVCLLKKILISGKFMPTSMVSSR